VNIELILDGFRYSSHTWHLFKVERCKCSLFGVSEQTNPIIFKEKTTLMSDKETTCISQ